MATGEERLIVTDELSEYVLPEETDATWAYHSITYEGTFEKRSGSEFKSWSADRLSTPFLAQVGPYYILLSEAGVYNNNGEYCGCNLKTERDSHTLKWRFGLARDPEEEWNKKDEQTGDWVYAGKEGHRPFGAMYRGEMTPDGYYVDENGAWISG